MILKKNNVAKTQVCIVGSGLGGGTLALKLAEKKVSFVIVEAGGLEHQSNSVGFSNIGRGFGLRSTTSIQLGGTSNLWHGVLSPLDSMDFKKRDWIPNSGWEISLEDLKPFYREAATFLRVKDYDFFNLSKLPEMLKEKLHNIDFNRDVFKNKIFQQPLPEKRLQKDLLKVVKNSDNFHLFLNTAALELIGDDSGNINSLKVGKDDSTTFEIQADTFVISSGALETPRLLLNSSIKNDNIGKYLMDHPIANLCQIKPKKRKKAQLYSAIKYVPNVAIKTGLELKDSLQKELQLPNHTFYLRPSFTKGIDNQTEKIKLSLLTFRDGGVSLKDIWRVLTNLNVIIQVLVYKFSLNPRAKYFDLWFVTEQIPSKESSVGLSSVKDKWGYRISQVNWKVSKLDIDFICQWYKLVRERCFNLNEFEFSSDFNENDWKKDFTSAAHHVGTARMGASMKDSVVDKNLKVFETKNLYVCDGSVFTTAGNVNSGLTIATFACRLAKHLTSKMQ